MSNKCLKRWEYFGVLPVLLLFFGIVNGLASKEFPFNQIDVRLEKVRKEVSLHDANHRKTLAEVMGFPFNEFIFSFVQCQVLVIPAFFIHDVINS